MDSVGKIEVELVGSNEGEVELSSVGENVVDGEVELVGENNSGTLLSPDPRATSNIPTATAKAMMIKAENCRWCLFHLGRDSVSIGTAS